MIAVQTIPQESSSTHWLSAGIIWHLTPTAKSWMGRGRGIQQRAAAAIGLQKTQIGCQKWYPCLGFFGNASKGTSKIFKIGMIIATKFRHRRQTWKSRRLPAPKKLLLVIGKRRHKKGTLLPEIFQIPMY